MTLSKRLTNNIAMFSLVILALLYWQLFDFLRWDMFDSPSFVGAARQMFGLEGGYNFQSRLSKPLALVVPGLLEYVTGLEAQYGFIIQSTLSYFGCALLIKGIVFKLTNRYDLSLYAMYIYIFCQPFAIFSLMILTDAPGWFVGLYIIYAAVNKAKNNHMNSVGWAGLALISAIGLLVKESVVFSFIFLIVYQFLMTDGLRQKLINLTISGLAFTMTFILTQWFTHLLFDDSILGRLFAQQERVGFVYYSKSNIGQLFRVIDYYWLLVLVGVASWRLSIRQYALKKELIALSFATLLSIALMPLYPFIVDRILFMVAPSLVVFSVLSYVYLKKFLFPLIFFGGILNIGTAWFIYRYDTNGLLFWGILTFGLFVLIGLLLETLNGMKNRN